MADRWPQVKDQLFGVQKIYSTRFGAFAALREDGHVVTWGHPDSGGDSSSVKAQLWTPGVKSVYGVKSAVFECVWWLNEGDFRRKSVARMLLSPPPFSTTSRNSSDSESSRHVFASCSLRFLFRGM